MIKSFLESSQLTEEIYELAKQNAKAGPTNAEFRDTLIEVMIRRGDIKGAKLEHEKATIVCSKREPALTSFGEQLVRGGKYQGGIKFLAEAYRLKPELVLHSNWLNSTSPMACKRKGSLTSGRLPRLGRMISLYDTS